MNTATMAKDLLDMAPNVKTYSNLDDILSLPKAIRDDYTHTQLWIFEPVDYVNNGKPYWRLMNTIHSTSSFVSFDLSKMSLSTPEDREKLARKIMSGWRECGDNRKYHARYAILHLRYGDIYPPNRTVMAKPKGIQSRTPYYDPLKPDPYTQHERARSVDLSQPSEDN